MAQLAIINSFRVLLNTIPLNEASSKLFHIADDMQNMFTLEAKYDERIEDLMYGKFDSFEMPFQGTICNVSIHPRLTHRGFPLIVFKSNNKPFAIKFSRESQKAQFVHRVHVIPPSLFSNLENIDPTTCKVLPHNIDFEALISAVLQESPRDVSHSTLFVDGQDIIGFVKALTENSNCTCTIMVTTSNDPMFAFVQVENDNEPIYSLSLGTVLPF